MAKFMVAIAHGKGVIGCHQYFGKINGEKFSQMVKDYFPALFASSANSKKKVFLQDGDPSQNSKVARDAWKPFGCSLFPIPARSPDLNPIENVFHLIGKKIKNDAKNLNIKKETYVAFSRRAKATTLAFSPSIINKTIESMPARVKAVIKSKGERTKY